MAIGAVEIAVKVIKGNVSTDYPASSPMGEDWKDPWQGSNSEHSSLELPSRGASPEVLPASKVGAILTPVCSCDESPGCSIGKSISLYLSKFVRCKVLSKIL